VKPRETGEPEVLRRLEDEAQRLRDERYPGDLMEDIRPRLARRRAWPRYPWRWLLPAAATLVLVTWLGQRRQQPTSRPSASASPSAAAAPSGASLARPPSLSPFQTIRVSTPSAVHLPMLSAGGLPSMGTALSGGARALSQVRPVSLESMKKEER